MKTSIFANIEQLVKQRQGHMDALAQIDQTLAGIKAMLNGGPPVRSKPGRPAMKSEDGGMTGVGGGKTANGSAPVTLADHLEEVIQKAGKPVAIADLTSGVKFAGYKSKSKNLRPVVSLALIKDKRFKRTGRSVYGLK
jgi:hypothetical protein